MGWFRRLTGVSLKSKSRTGSPAPRDPADVDQAATPPGPSSRPAALEAGASPQIPGSPRASNPGAHRPGHRRTRSREAFGGRDDGIPVVPPRSPGFDAARGHQGFRDDPHARSPRGPSSGPPSFGRSSPSPVGSVRGGDEFVRPLGLSNLGEHARISNGGGGTHGGDGDGTAGGGWGSNTAGGWGSRPRHRRLGSRGSVGADTTSSGHSDDRTDTVRTGFYLAPAPMKPRRWTKGDCLGSGSFGTVYLGLNGETGELFAVKEVAMTRRTGEGGEGGLNPQPEEDGIDASATEAVEQLEQEVELLSRLQHPNIVRYVGISRESRALYIFLEYVPGGSIASLLSRFGAFEESVISVYTRQILIGLDYLHSQRCVHRDIKGGNILVEKSGRIKLADFGMAKSLVEQMADGGSFKGSAYWMAPEVIRQKGSGNHPAADVWSVGCTVIEMASGEHPWGDCSGQVQAIFKIASTKELPRVPEQLSPAASEFVLMCLQRDPDARPDSEALLLHPFVVNAQVDVEVPALRYEGYWSDEFDEDDSRFGGFDGGSEHGAPTSGPASSTGPSDAAHSKAAGGGFVTSGSSDNSSSHRGERDERCDDDDLNDDDKMDRARLPSDSGAPAAESPPGAWTARGASGRGRHSRRGSRTSLPDVSSRRSPPPPLPRVGDWRTEVEAMRGAYGGDEEEGEGTAGGGGGGGGGRAAGEEVEFGASARSMRVRGLLDLPPLPAMGAPKPPTLATLTRTKE